MRNSLIRDEEGQAIFEYVLILTIVVSAVLILGVGFRKIIFKLWLAFTKEIAAPCPGCEPPQGIR